MVSRPAALEAVREEHAQRERELYGLPDEVLREPGLLPGGHGDEGPWSGADLIAHLMTWDSMFVQTIDAWHAREMPWFLAPEYEEWETARWLNSDGIKDRRAIALDDLRAQARELERSIVAGLEDLDDDAWARTVDFAHGAPTLGGWLQTAFSHPRGEPFRHLPMHAAEVEILGSRRRT